MGINSKEELSFYIMADRMMNRGYFKPSFVRRVKNLLQPDYIMKFLFMMRKTSYYYATRTRITNRFLYHLYLYRFNRLGLKLGFTIPHSVFGYGLVLVHYGTIVVGGGNNIGNYAVLHNSSCITDIKRIIGDGLYVSTGAKITTKYNLGDAVTVAANSVVTKGCEEGYALLSGVPAIKKSERMIWYEQEGGIFNERVKLIETKRLALFLNHE